VGFSLISSHVFRGRRFAGEKRGFVTTGGC
jgi:hypothetical protein